ncbi:MAG: metallophosphoesterase [Saprospiraceae bacterium]|nr:metallophosphoesterase [Bacteroidia bacterium]NNE15027.1 metallophosphoesterase [Saprospiraceae bacterium]NNL91335.1 metallophosphoesterase [Saprospiraceae bacterium]
MYPKKNKLPFDPQKSVDWYDPRQLAKTGIKFLISTTLGNFADKREMQAALDRENEKLPYDYSNKKENLWVDYISDLGDGFDATYTMAVELSKRELSFENHKTTQGKILIMGGDQVYPAPDRKEYDNRLAGPYETANPLRKGKKKNRPLLFAIPGNHDWYDGLTNFLKRFCQKRLLGNWVTDQRRSYFALKLSSKVWLFGIDIQLNSDIDIHQINYFKNIMACYFESGCKIILCTAEPSWVYKTSYNKKRYQNLKYFEGIICKSSKDAEVVITLAGDLHHYARYESQTGTQKITAGGGGAFMHPTHHLPDSISKLGDSEDETFNLKTCFPSHKESKRLLFRNLIFPLSSWKLSILFGVLYFVFGSSLNIHFNSNAANITFFDYFIKSILNPTSVIIITLLLFSLFVFSDTNPYNHKFKSPLIYKLFGCFHGLIQVSALLVSYWYIRSVPSYSLILMFLCGCILAGSILGVYLILSSLILKNHDNEAYSSLRWKGYKNFIRLHITSSEITIFPIGVRDVPEWNLTNGSELPFKSSFDVKSFLIEDPIVIKI